MLKAISLLIVASLALAGPEYTESGDMKFPQHYREWIYLSSGMDMSYEPAAQKGPDHAFDNVFVDPDSYKAFLATGHWPDKTMLILEVRAGESKGSINQSGNFQGELQAIEMHVKDTARFKGGWAFYSFNGTKPGKLLPQTASCYSCHEEHGAVDSTFVQFYPTLLPIATSKRTLARSYLAEEAARK